MSIQTLTLSQIQPSVLNPRKFFNDTTIEELAQSIKTDGLLQNLVVLKPKGKTKKHNLIAGERRFRAISHLIEKGELDKDFAIKVEIKEGLSDDEALRIATVENVQRENLSPLEEAEALTVLVKCGAEMDTIIAQTGLSLTTIRRRLMLLSLAEDAKTALQEQKITLAQAEALAIGSVDARHFLEPNAGKGDIAEAIVEKRGRYSRYKVDCIESAPELVSILIDKDFPVVGHDWLTYDGVCYYDAILMNPPFSNGDDHLLKAWDFMHNGEIVCLLNEETVKNPHTAARKRLAAIIEAHGNVEYLGACFSTAQRKTDVRVAMVYLKKVSEDDSIDLWANVTEEKSVNDNIGADANMLAIRDNLGNMQHYYDKANEHMNMAFQHIRKAGLYLNANDVYTGQDYEKILQLAFKNINDAKAEFGRKHRRDAWMHVFNQMEFHRWLDKKQREEFVRDIERNGNIPFTKENIKGTLENVFLQRGQLFEKSVANVFDELTRYYKGNTNHIEGWKTNDSYKVNKKIVFPWGCKFEKDYGRYFCAYHGSNIDIYHDLDRVLCVLSGKDFKECGTIAQAMRRKFEILGRGVSQGFDNQTESEFFHIKFWMKGTVHLTFKDKDLWARFNITAAKGKQWLGQQTQKEAA